MCRTKKRPKKNGCNTEKSYTFLTLAINPSFNFFDHVEDVDVLCKLCCAGVRDPYRELYMDKKKEYVVCVCVWRAGKIFFQDAKKKILLLGEKKSGEKNPKK